MDRPLQAAALPPLLCLPSLESVRVLATEDQVFHQEILKRALIRHGAFIEMESDGASTLARDDLRHFDVMLLDLMLPDTDGIELAASIRSAGVETPLIAVTAGTMTYTREMCIDAGFAGFLEKPFSPIGLAEIIRSVCRKTIKD